MIISASRRTDIPSYYGEWFVNRLKEGHVLIQNPYNAQRYSRAILTRDSVDLIMFWTKNPLPFMKHLHSIESMGYPYAFQFTITPYGVESERALPDKEALVNAFIELSERIGKGRMYWRYDPIIISDKYPIDYHANKFAMLAEKLAPYAARCIISFVDGYKNVASRMGKDPTYHMTDANMREVAKLLSNTAKMHNLSVFTCAEQLDLSEFGIEHGACIDKTMVEEILSCKISARKDKNQRKECLCVESIDIGTYNCCANGCDYCYALTSEHASRENMKRHDPKSPVLIGQVNPHAIVTHRPSESIEIAQMSFFND